METLEKLIALVMTLFTLSLISERVINWIKLYFGQAGKKLLFFTGADEDISKQSDDPKLNTIRDRKILGLNIFICVLIAFLVHANLFDFLKENNPAEHLGWNDFEWPKNWIYLAYNTILGCLLSGLCMSMGSKFWHDTLDLLFYAKNLRKKLSEKETYEMGSSEQLEEWLSKPRYEIVKQVLNENRQKIMALPEVIGCGITLNDLGEELIEIRTKNSVGYPNSYPYQLPNGLTLEIPVVIRQ